MGELYSLTLASTRRLKGTKDNGRPDKGGPGAFFLAQEGRRKGEPAPFVPKFFGAAPGLYYPNRNIHDKAFLIAPIFFR